MLRSRFAAAAALAVGLAACRDAEHPREVLGTWTFHATFDYSSPDRPATMDRRTAMTLSPDGTGQMVGQFSSALNGTGRTRHDTFTFRWRVRTTEEGAKRLCVERKGFGEVLCGSVTVDPQRGRMALKPDSGEAIAFTREGR